MPSRPFKPDADAWIICADTMLRSLSGSARAARAVPEPSHHAIELSLDDRRLSGALMRVNHVGELCAQALYSAQAATARTPELRAHFAHAALEETDHLAWTAQRLRALGARHSLLDPLWYIGAFGLGVAAGRLGDAWSLGFVVETERQVERHLDGHLTKLPASDAVSRAIVEQMKVDEGRHAQEAEQRGSRSLPLPVRWAMTAAAKLMTIVAHRI